MIGNLIDLETCYIIKLLSDILIHSTISYDIAVKKSTIQNTISNDLVNLHIFQKSFNSINQSKNFIFINTDLLFKSPLLFLKLKDLVNKKQMFNKWCFYLGIKPKETLPSSHHYSLSNNFIIKWIEGRNFFNNILKIYKNLNIFIYNTYILNLLLLLIPKSFKLTFFNILSNVSQINKLSAGLSETKLKKIFFKKNSLYYLIGNADSFLTIKTTTTKNFFIQQTHHGDYLTKYINLILPTNTFVEKKTSYLNTFGLYSNTEIAITNPGYPSLIMKFYIYVINY